MACTLQQACQIALTTRLPKQPLPCLASYVEAHANADGCIVCTAHHQIATGERSIHQVPAKSEYFRRVATIHTCYPRVFGTCGYLCTSQWSVHWAPATCRELRNSSTTTVLPASHRLQKLPANWRARIVPTLSRRSFEHCTQMFNDGDRHHFACPRVD